MDWIFEKVWVLTGKEKGYILFHVVLDEHFICPSVVTRKHVMRYCTFPQLCCNHVPGTRGVVPSAIHFFHHVRCFGHVLQLVVEEKAFI